jgi:hypothetical protein
MSADFGAPAPYPENEVGAGMHRRKFGYPDVLKQPHDRELALLIDQGVISQNGEVEMQRSGHAD